MANPDFFNEFDFGVSEGQTSDFEQPLSLFSTTTIYGVVSDVQREQAHYSFGHKLLRSIFAGEPFQFNRSGRNSYGSTCAFTSLRVEALDGSGLSREITCYTDRIFLRPGDEVEVTVSVCRRTGAYIANHIHVVNTGSMINARGYSIPASVVRVLAVLLPLLVIDLVSGIIAGINTFFTGGGFSRMLDNLMPSIIVIAGIVILFRSLFPRRDRGRWY